MHREVIKFYKPSGTYLVVPLLRSCTAVLGLLVYKIRRLCVACV